MKNINIKYIFFNCKICLLLLVLLFFISANDVFAQKKSKKRTKKMELEVELSLSTVYDDNILKYSEKYLERFRNNEDGGRFHIKTYDDVILNPSIQVTSTFNIFGKLKSKINGQFSSRQYVVNPIKNWDFITFGFQQYLSKQASFKFYYSNIPEFYVRHFRDRQWVNVYGYTQETYQPFAFAKNNYGFYIQNTFFKNTRIRYSMSYSQYFHNKHFTEYDCKNYSYGLRIYQLILKKVKLEAGYEYTTSDAKGYDASYETPQTTNGPDASNVEDNFSLALIWQVPAILKLDHELRVEGEFFKVYYSSEHPLELDEEHAGRVDDNLRLYFTYSVQLNKALQVSAFYNWLMRDTNTEAKENQEYLNNEKSYNQNLFGIELSYKLKL